MIFIVADAADTSAPFRWFSVDTGAPLRQLAYHSFSVKLYFQVALQKRSFIKNSFVLIWSIDHESKGLYLVNQKSKSLFMFVRQLPAFLPPVNAR